MKKSLCVLLLISGVSSIKVQQYLEPEAVDIQKQLDAEDSQKQQNLETQAQLHQMLGTIAQTTEGTVGQQISAKVEEHNKEIAKQHEATKPSGVGIDVADWANDEVYFNRVFK